MELSTILVNFESIVNSVVSLFLKLSDTTNFTKEIKDKLLKIYTDLNTSENQLSLDPSTISTHLIKIRYLTDLQVELLREARIRVTLLEI